MKKISTKKIVISALFAAITCIATIIIKIPSPLKGYLNIGDCIILLTGWMLSSGYSFLAAGIGSALADLLSGYLVYAPATFIIKGTMAVIACVLSKGLNKIGNMPSKIISGIVAEGFMVLGYYLFEGLLYGFGPSLVNIPANCVQGTAGLILGCILIKLFKNNIIIQNNDQ